jgi:ABC-type glycerol-3-phosphate transport system permease component
MMAMAMTMIVPMLLVFAVGQKYFIQGVVFSGLKG